MFPKKNAINNTTPPNMLFKVQSLATPTRNGGHGFNPVNSPRKNGIRIRLKRLIRGEQNPESLKLWLKE